MGWLSDFVSDPIGSVTSGLETVGNAVGDIGQWAGDTVGNTWQQTYNNIDDVWKSGVDLTRNYLTLGTDIVVSGVQDPTDINAWSDPAQDHLDKFNKTGNDLFGTGGWIKAGANMLSAGNPFQGAGSLGYQLDAAASGNSYNNGQTSGISSVLGLYNLGNDIYNSSTSGSLPTDSNTYKEATPGGGSITVKPSDFYGGATTSSNIGNITQGNNVGDYKLPDNSYMNPDMGTLGTGTYGTGTQSPDTGGLGYGSYGVPGGENSIPSTPTPGLIDQLSGYLNSGYGKLARAGLSLANPQLGAVANGLAGAGNGDIGKAAFDTLSSLYLNNRANRVNRQYQDQMNGMIGQLSNLYSNNSPYAQQLRQELERKDAAAGRRSQYGGRETQLQAMLAEKQAGLTPIQNILTSQAMQNSIAQQQAARSRQFADLKSIFAPAKPGGQSQGSGSNLAQGGWDKVKEIWGSF